MTNEDTPLPAADRWYHWCQEMGISPEAQRRVLTSAAVRSGLRNSGYYWVFADGSELRADSYLLVSK